MLDREELVLCMETYAANRWDMRRARTYFVKGQHLTCHLPTVVERYSHAVVDQVLHLALFVRHAGKRCARVRLRMGWKVTDEQPRSFGRVGRRFRVYRRAKSVGVDVGFLDMLQHLHRNIKITKLQTSSLATSPIRTSFTKILARQASSAPRTSKIRPHLEHQLHFNAHLAIYTLSQSLTPSSPDESQDGGRQRQELKSHAGAAYRQARAEHLSWRVW